MAREGRGINIDPEKKMKGREFSFDILALVSKSGEIAYYPISSISGTINITEVFKQSGELCGTEKPNSIEIN